MGGKAKDKLTTTKGLEQHGRNQNTKTKPLTTKFLGQHSRNQNSKTKPSTTKGTKYTKENNRIRLQDGHSASSCPPSRARNQTVGDTGNVVLVARAAGKRDW